MILFEKLRWRNFLSTGNQFTEIDLKSNNITLIVGENGAGKSTILDALSFSLFGKPFRNVNKAQLVNTINKKDTVCEIDFTIGKNKYTIRRGIKPNVFEVFLNGNLIDQNADKRDYQDVLEKQILKINHKSFCQVVVLGSASFVPFMQLTAANRRAIIEDILDLQIFTKMNVLLKDKIQQNSQDLLITEGELKLVREKIRLQSEHRRDTIASFDKFVGEKRQQIDSFRQAVDESNNRLDELQSEIVLLKKEGQVLQEECKKVDKLKEIQVQLNQKISQCTKTIEFFKTHDSCPTCKQTIEEEFKTTTILSKEQQIVSVEDGLGKLKQSLDQFAEKQIKLSDINATIFEKNVDVGRVQTKIQQWTKTIQTLDQEIDDLKKEKQEIVDDSLDQYKLEESDLESKYNTLQEDKIVLSTASLILKDGGIKAKIVKQYIPIINKLINKYLASMDFFVNFQLNEQFEETIKSRFRDEFSYASFSEGEKQKIDLALLFTWRAIAKIRNSMSTNLLIMDEVFDSSLDSNATDNLMQIVQQLATESNIFIISHKEQMSDKFSSILRFEKSKNFSVLK